MSIKPIGIYIMAVLFVCAASGGALAGEEESPVAVSWGNAYLCAKKSQIEHPDAGKYIRPVTSFDGKAAELAVEGYRADFGKGQAPQNYNINLGEISGVGMK